MIFYCSTCDLSYYNHRLIIATRPLGKPTSNIIITERSPGKYAIIIKFYDTCGNEFIFLYLAPQSIYSLENKPQICKIWMKYILFACSPQSFSKTSGTRLPDILFLTAIVFSSQQLIHGSRIDGGLLYIYRDKGTFSTSPPASPKAGRFCLASWSPPGVREELTVNQKRLPYSLSA